MNWIKIILIAAGLFVAVMLGLTVIGIVYSALWYLFWIGILAVGGVAAYKFINKVRIEAVGAEGTDCYYRTAKRR